MLYVNDESLRQFEEFSKACVKRVRQLSPILDAEGDIVTGYSSLPIVCLPIVCYYSDEDYKQYKASRELPGVAESPILNSESLEIIFETREPTYICKVFQVGEETANTREVFSHAYFLYSVESFKGKHFEHLLATEFSITENEWILPSKPLFQQACLNFGFKGVMNVLMFKNILHLSKPYQNCLLN